MKKMLLALSSAASLLGLAPAAHAADYGLAPSTYDWSGAYFGVNVGASMNTTQMNTGYHYTGPGFSQPANAPLIASLGIDDTASDVGFTGGMMAGYNMQMANVVVGIEADFNYLGLSGDVKRNADGVLSSVLTGNSNGANDTIHYEADWYGTLRARAGYAFDNILLYGTGGLAYGQMQVDQKLSGSDGTDYMEWKGSDEGWNLGWTIGGGLEYGVAEWTLGLEYLYVDLSSYGWTSNSDVSLIDDDNSADWSQVDEKGTADYRFSVARATIKYRF